MTHRIVLGTMNFGTLLDEPRSFDILDQFVDLGGEWLDTANCYSFWSSDDGFGGQSEAVLGRWMAQRPGVRDRVKISTKVGCEPLVKGGFPDRVEGLSRPAIGQALRSSLRRLGTDHVDLYWAHKPDPTTPLEETVAVMQEQLESGRVGRIGCSNFPVWQVERSRARSTAPSQGGFTAMQQHLTYLRPRPGTSPSVVHRFGAMTDETLHYLEHHPDIAFWSYTPLLNGRYAGPNKPLPDEYDHPGTRSGLQALDEVADDLSATRHEVVLAWVLSINPAVAAIVGVSDAMQLEQAFRGSSLVLTASHVERLASAR